MEEKEISGQSEPALKKKKDGLKRIITGACIFAALVVLFWARHGGYTLPFSITVFLLIFGGTWELTAALKERLTLPQRVVALVYSAGLAAPYYLSGGSLEAVLYYVLGFFLVAAVLSLFDKKAGLDGVTALFFAFIYPSLLLLCMILLNERAEGFTLLLLLFAAVSFSDIFAYTIGSMLGKGKRKLCPDISPNKTFIGAYGGLLGGLAGAILVWLAVDVLNLFALEYILFDGNLKIFHYIITGIFISLFTMAGDLFASLLKRKTGIKDYGKIFPGHGGVLDRFDGNMFAAVFLTLYMTLIF